MANTLLTPLARPGPSGGYRRATTSLNIQVGLRSAKTMRIGPFDTLENGGENLRCWPQNQSLGAVVKCKNLGLMTAFYEKVIGMDFLSAKNQTQPILLQIPKGICGHSGRVALMQETGPHSQIKQAARKLVLTMSFGELEATMDWLEHIEQPYRSRQIDWIGWRAIATRDPEGNVVELISY